MTSGDASTRGLDQDDVEILRHYAFDGIGNDALDRLEARIAEVEQQRDDALGERVIAQLDIAQARAEAAEARIAEVERERDTAIAKWQAQGDTLRLADDANDQLADRCEALTAALREIATGPSEVSPPEIARCALGWPAHGWGEPYADVPGAGQRGCG